MGIKKDLNLLGNDFSNTATWFFIAYLIAEVPNGLYLPSNFPFYLQNTQPVLIGQSQYIVYKKLLRPNGSEEMCFSGVSQQLPLLAPRTTEAY